MKKIYFFGIVAFLFASTFVHPSITQAEEKKPVATYWMTVATQNMSMPGMEQLQGMSGMGSAFGPIKTLHLELNSPQKLPPSPQATHDIPPGQKMGQTLPLLTPEREKAMPEQYVPQREEKGEKLEKPKARMLIYWGCGEEVRKGQPYIIDTEKMNPLEFGKALAGRTPSVQYPPSERKGWVYAEWPNRKSSIQVPKDSSLVGSHLVHGNYTPDIRFSISQKHDFMAPVEFTSLKGSLADSIRVEWKAIPTAVGYFATAMAHNEATGEMIFWSSSDMKETGFGLMDYLTPSDVQRFIKEKVVMTPDTTKCNIPKGIFSNTAGAMLQFIAYGEELNLVHPPKPKDPKEPWNPIWTMKLRLKSTGMTHLGAEEQETQRPGRARERETQKYREELREEEREMQAPREVEREPRERPLDRIRGIFGF